MISNSRGFILKDGYLNGRQVCENKVTPYSKFIRVYKDPIARSGSTEIFYYTQKEFNKNLPSVLFFTGGPGVNPRSTEFDLKNANVIFFDQRGSGCSRPQSQSDYLDPNFYNSLFTAYDALEIVKDLKISQVTLYGQSYGTVPATIFGSVFSEISRNVILEGVIFRGDDSLWHSKRKQTNLMKVFSSLEKTDQNKVLEMNQRLPKNWFSKIGDMMLYLDDGVHIYQNFLNTLFGMDEVSQTAFVNNFYPEEKLEEDFDFGDVMMGMIACQELSMNNPHVSRTMIFDQNQNLIFDQNNIDKKERCDKLKIKKSLPFSAMNYPLKVPTLYLLGENDGATDLDQGLNHAHYVSREKATILLKKEGGHLPALGLFKDDRKCDDSIEDCSHLSENRLIKQIFEQFVSQSNFDDSTLKQLNAVIQWPWIKNPRQDQIDLK